ncbi:MAG: sensor histidine kinase [Solirubrobacteraceae bacterium]
MSSPRPRSLRWRLTLRVAVVLVVAFAVTFFAVYRGTGAQLQGQIDHELRSDATAFAQAVAGPAEAGKPGELVEAGSRYMSVQPFRATSRLLFEEVPGQPTQTNEPELLGLRGGAADEGAEKQSSENVLAQALLAAPVGFSTLPVPDVGELRLLVAPVRVGRATVARVGVGEPLETVRRAQEGVRHTFLLAGGLTLAAALLASYLLAARFSEPVRRIAAIAARVDAGDLTPRIAAAGRRDEVRVLADAFDRMLDRLEDAFARQRSFVSDASHELRTPLTAIRGQLEVLALDESPDPEDVRRVERLVLGEVDRMSRLVDDLLFLARADETRVLSRESIDLASYVGELFELSAGTAARRFEQGPVPPGTLEADPSRLAQALRNVVANAIEHTQEGGLVRLGTEVTGGRVRFVIEDDGPGIPEDQRNLVFERFHRTDSSRARSAGGAGLGLAIVREIVVAHGGTVKAGESGEGGARVELELPGFRPV